MVIAIVSDTHLTGSGRALPAQCVAVMRAADLIVHAGDFSTLDVLEEIESLGPPVKAVFGNVDSEELRRRLPAETTFGAGGATFGIVHDGGPARERLQRLRARFPHAQAIVFGHSHMPLHEASGGFQIFNPGSPTQRRRAPQHTMGIAHAERGTVRFEHIPLS